MNSTCFDVSESDNVGHLVMNRPEAMNSMIPDFWTDLPRIVNELSDSGRVRALVISSTGKHFSAGMDLSVFGGGSGDDDVEMGRRRAAFRSNVLHLQETFSCLERARMPVLVAIQGGAVGGAVDMVTAADMRYGTKDCWFCIQETNIAMTADVGTFPRLPKLIPEGIAREMAYRGHRLPAARAMEIGLLNAVFDDHETLVDGVLEIAAEIASKSPLAIAGCKEMLNYSRDHSTADTLNHIATWQAGMFQPTDMAESFEAKTEGREPEFQNLAPIRRGL